MSVIQQILLFLVETLFSLYIGAIIIRFLLGYAKADFYNPLSQFLVKVTNPVLVPLRRFLPAVGKLDTSAVVAAYVLTVIKSVIIFALIGKGLSVIGILGFSLKELIDLDGPQSPARTVWILDQICRSLREAHGKGLIHRDIKPQNIMLCRRGGEYDAVKVLDFGLARNLGTVDGNRVTETQLLIGTPLYIAPERIVDPTCMDPRSDIYSLGILAYFLLTGREPFDATDSIDALAQTINRTARRPSEQSPGAIPEVLDRLIRDCHSRAITDRPETMEVVLSRLHDVHLVEPWDAEQAASWWNRHRAEVTTTMEKMANVKSERTTATLAPPSVEDLTSPSA